jgi:hypothetical protein
MTGPGRPHGCRPDHVPHGKPTKNGPSEPQPGDAQIGGWSRDRLEQMDAKFVERVQRSLAAKH